MNSTPLPPGPTVRGIESTSFIQTVQSAVDEGEAFELTYRIVAPDGTEKRVWERGQGVYASDGDLEAIEGFVTDVTDRDEPGE